MEVRPRREREHGCKELTVAAAVLSAALFLVAWRLSGIYPRLLSVFSLSREAARAMMDASLDDDQKERLARRYALEMFGGFLGVTFRAAVVLAPPVGALLILDALDVVEFRSVAELLARWEVILGATVAALIVWLAQRALHGPDGRSRE